MRRREPRSAGGPGELEALDPLTGESLFGESSPATATALPPAIAAARAVRFRRMSRLLAVLAVGCAAAAAYFGVTITQLRGIERTWRTALAFDAVRAAGDDAVRATVAEVGGDERDAAEALRWVGDETTVRLVEAEQELAERRILDSKVSALRDEMRAALEFRRFQLTPQRTQMGDTPLRKVDGAIEAQLDRWGLAPVEVDAVALRSVGREIGRLHRFTDEPTGVTLMGMTPGGVLVTIDVDRSRAQGRELGRTPVVGVFPAPNGAAVWNGGNVTVFPADDAADPVAQVPASRPVFEVGDGSGDLWVVEAVGGGPRATTVRRFRPVAGATFQAPVQVPLGKQVVGGAAGRLVLADEATGALALYSPPTAGGAASTVVLSTGPARFLAGDERRVLWQGALPFGDSGSDGFLHLFHIATSARELLALPPTDAATGSLTDDGTIAIAAGPSAGRIGSVLVAEAGTAALVGVEGPRSSVRGNAPRWSDDGQLLFWLTPEGRVAMRRGTGPEARSSMVRTGLDGLSWLVVVDR